MMARFLYAFLLALSALAPVARVEAAWPDDGDYAAWSHCFKLTTQATKIDGALDWYWLDLDDMPPEFWANVKANGGDLRFVEDDLTTAIYHRLIFIDTGTGKGLVAVAQPHGASGATVNIDSYVFVGNAGASAPGLSPFPNTVEGLWMLQEAPTSSAAVTDWSGNGRNSTSIAGSMTSGDLITDSPHSGLKSLDFDSNDRVVLPSTIFDDVETNGTLTFWSWARPEYEGASATGLFASETNQFQVLHSDMDAINVLLRNSTNSGEFVADSGAWQGWYTGEWALIHVVWNGSTLKAYHNGVERASVAATSIRNNTSAFSLGRGYSLFWRGKIGETGVASNALSADQVVTMRTNVNDSAFWLIEEYSGGGGAGPTIADRTRGFMVLAP